MKKGGVSFFASKLKRAQLFDCRSPRQVRPQALATSLSVRQNKTTQRLNVSPLRYRHTNMHLSQGHTGREKLGTH